MIVVFPDPDGPKIRVSIFLLTMIRTAAGQGSLDLENTTDRRITFISPKRTPRDTAIDGKLPWGLAYAAYSRNFANAAIEELSGKKKRTIVDPFVGSGTTVAASLTHGCNCIGIDLNPYSALTSRARGATGSDSEAIRSILGSLKKKISAKNDREVEGPASHRATNELLKLLAKRLQVEAPAVLQTICRQKDHKLDSELVALCSMTYASRLLSAVTRGSNPAWLRHSLEANIPPAASVLIDTAQAIAETVSETFVSEDFPVASRWTQIFNTDFSDADIAQKSISRFLTSPPYLNRLDYVRSTLPEIIRLGADDGEKIESLRTQMMGTTKIRKHDSPASQNLRSPLSSEILDKIFNHSSQASPTYYYRFFLQYFLDLERFFGWLSAKSTNDAAGIIVVQDSYYKDLKIPLEDIFCEVGERYQFKSEIISRWEKVNHIGQMSPTQRKHAPGKILTESVILFSKAAG